MADQSPPARGRLTQTARNALATCLALLILAAVIAISLIPRKHRRPYR